MARLLIEERYTWPVRTVPLGGGSLWATSYQIQRCGEVVIQMLANVRQTTIEPLIKTTVLSGTLIDTNLSWFF